MNKAEPDIREYIIEINNEGEEAVDEFSFDIYREGLHIHPDGHYGFWNKNIKLNRGLNIVRVKWDWHNKTVIINDEMADNVWKGHISGGGRYKLLFILYRGNQKYRSEEIVEHVGKENGGCGCPDKLVSPDHCQAGPALRTAIWFLTWRCNNKCPYCWEVQRQAKGEFVPEDFTDAEKWVNAWNRIKPGVLDISGGEPWLQPGFIDMLEQFDKGIKVAITTNATKDLTEFVQRISPEKVFSMTLSFHPTQRMSADMFLGKCLLLKNRGFHITVNYVTWPEQMWLIPVYKEFFETHGLRFHVDPYAATPHNPFTFSGKEKEFLKQYVGEDRAHWFGEVEKYDVLCSGGQGHLNVQPNGDAFRCINDKILNKGMVGNILDTDFKLNTQWTHCADYYRCPGCDKDKIKIKRIREEKTSDKSGAFSYTL